MEQQKLKSITVIFRNDGPMIYAGGIPSRRRVTVQLTDDQIEQLKPKFAYQSGKERFYEEIELMFPDFEETSE